MHFSGGNSWHTVNLIGTPTSPHYPCQGWKQYLTVRIILQGLDVQQYGTNVFLIIIFVSELRARADSLPPPDGRTVGVAVLGLLARCRRSARAKPNRPKPNRWRCAEAAAARGDAGRLGCGEYLWGGALSKIWAWPCTIFLKMIFTGYVLHNVRIFARIFFIISSCILALVQDIDLHIVIYNSVLY
jgi:hypothetical protein